GGRSRVHAASAGMPRAARTPHSTGSASELLARAHERVRRAQDRAAKRMSGRRIASYSNRPNAGVALASLLTVGGIAAFVGYSLVNAKSGGRDFELGLDGLPRVIITTDAGDVPAPVALRAEDGSIRISDSQLQAFADLGRRVKTQIESRVAM